MISPDATRRPTSAIDAAPPARYGGGMLQMTSARARPRAISNWLWVVAAMILAIVAIGGITRLTESGLSITQWKPISGIVPPLNHAAWQAEFDNYKTIPEYARINRGMTLSGFKAIFFWEYLHRLLARLIGTVFALPLIWFAVRRQIPAGYGWRLSAILALGALQGAIGWWMVKSGLSVRTDVSHLRLATHLVTALVTLAGTVWTALDLRALHRVPFARPARLRPVAIVALLTLFAQIILGAFTAGLDAGYAFASWPLMGDAWFPADGWHAGWSPLRNAIDNPIVVQFLHRWTAFAAAAAVIWLAALSFRHGSKAPGQAIVALVIAQILLGISTLMSGVQIGIAVAHQVNAALLLIAVTLAAHQLGRGAPRSVAGRAATG